MIKELIKVVKVIGIKRKAKTFKKKTQKTKF